jgi:site-specific recombinase XerD
VKGVHIISEEKITFDMMAKDLLTDYRVNGKRSVESAELSVKHLRRFFALDRALDITTDRVRAYVSTRQTEGNGSINRELAALKRMFSVAVQASKLSSKPHILLLEENSGRPRPRWSGFRGSSRTTFGARQFATWFAPAFRSESP